MKVLWPHNFTPDIKSSGNFMHILADAIRKLGVEVDLEYLGDLKKPKNIIADVRLLYNKAKEYDLIHAQFGSMCGFIVSMVPGTKILSLRGSDWYGTSSGSLKVLLRGKLQRMLTRMSLKKYDGIIVMSRRMQKEVRKIYLGENLVYIPDGISLDIFYPMDRYEARKALGEKDDSPWVLFPSVMKNNPVKRRWLAEQAYMEAKKVIPNLKFKIASGIDYQDMPKFVNSSNVVLMVSTHEGGPNSIKEALACNVPFVTTDVADLKEISEKESSCFVTDADPKLLGEAIVKSIRQDRPNNLRKHVEHVQLDLIAKNIVDFYELVLSKKKS